jgi:hypothetical protein
MLFFVVTISSGLTESRRSKRLDPRPATVEPGECTGIRLLQHVNTVLPHVKHLHLGSARTIKLTFDLRLVGWQPINTLPWLSQHTL